MWHTTYNSLTTTVEIKNINKYAWWYQKNINQCFPPAFTNLKKDVDEKCYPKPRYTALKDLYHNKNKRPSKEFVDEIYTA